MSLQISEENNVNHPHSQHSAGDTWKFKWETFIMDLLVFLLTFIEICLVLYLSILHFSHNQGIVGILMLTPIFLNIVAVTSFLSIPQERWIFENISGTKCFSDLYQIPVFGPAITAFRIMITSLGWANIKEPTLDYERLDASATKLRIAVTFFTTVPEIIVQTTNLLINKQDLNSLEKYLELTAIFVGLVSLAEANCYGLYSNYYRLFRRHKENSWELIEFKFLDKVLFFSHAFFSIGSRLMATSLIISAAFFYYRQSFGYALVIVILCELIFRMFFYYTARFAKFYARKKEIPSSCHESINYAWRSTVLDFGFQSKNDFVQIWFYLENILAFILWHFVAKDFSSDWVKETLFTPVTVSFIVLNIFSIIFLLVCQRAGLAHLRGLSGRTRGGSVGSISNLP